MTKQEVAQVANILCTISEDLWRSHKETLLQETSKPWMVSHLARGNPLIFNARVGSGKATYYTSKRSRGVLLLNYGAKMVASKCESPLSLSRWLTGREILNRGYMDGDLTIENGLAHTILHEFAHVWQDMRGEVRDHSIHNDEFYSILDGMYENRWHVSVLSSLSSLLKRSGITLSFLRPHETMSIANELRPSLKKGQRISFFHEKVNATVHAIVKTLNKKTVSVTACRDSQYSFVGRVPYGLIQVSPTPTSEKPSLEKKAPWLEGMDKKMEKLF